MSSLTRETDAMPPSYTGLSRYKYHLNFKLQLPFTLPLHIHLPVYDNTISFLLTAFNKFDTLPLLQ